MIVYYKYINENNKINKCNNLKAIQFDDWLLFEAWCYDKLNVYNSVHRIDIIDIREKEVKIKKIKRK